MPSHPPLPPGLWTLPGALRGDRPPLRQQMAVDGVSQTLDIQASLAPYQCQPIRDGAPWKGRARPRIFGPSMGLALLGSFTLVWLWLGKSELVAMVAAVATCLPLIKLLSALYLTRIVNIDDTSVALRWRRGFTTSTLRLPLSDFSGVARWSGSRLQSIPLFTWRRRWWVVALVHRTTPQCSVPLLLSDHFAPVIKAQQAAAQTFGLPLLLEAPHGAAWRPRPVEDLACGLGARLNEIWASEVAPIPLPQQAIYDPGGALALGREISDRWLWLLFFAPLGGLSGGVPGLIGGLIPATLVYASLWGYWRRGDSWTCNGKVLDLTLARRWQGPQTVRLDCKAVLAARVVAAGYDSCLEIETQSRVYNLRLGHTPARQARDSLEKLFACLRQG